MSVGMCFVLSVHTSVSVYHDVHTVCVYSVHRSNLCVCVSGPVQQAASTPTHPCSLKRPAPAGPGWQWCHRHSGTPGWTSQCPSGV